MVVKVMVVEKVPQNKTIACRERGCGRTCFSGVSRLYLVLPDGQHGTGVERQPCLLSSELAMSLLLYR